MSVHDEGYGDNARPTLEFESDFANRFRSVGAEGDKSWGAPAQPPHRSEEPFMTSRAGRPGQAPMGPRSLGHSNQNGAAPSYQAPGNPGRNYTAPDFPNPFPPMNYQPQQPSYQPQGYQAEPATTPNRQMPSQPAPMQPIAQPARAYQ